jgi:PhzF family phenazine biosynthesis protein
VSGVEVLRYAAFTDGGAGGNPAGVVLDAAALDDDARLAIAARVGYSETAFLSGGSGAYQVRYFSPLAEVDFCGHATIAAAVALAERVGPGLVRFATRVGEIPVLTASGPSGFTATLTSVPTCTRPVVDLSAALSALRLASSDLSPRFPPHIAFGGNDHLMLGLSSRQRLAALDYDFDALGQLMASCGWTTVHLFWAENSTTFHARNPFPPGGVIEDPATGAAAVAFGGYLRTLGLVPVPGRVTIFQGADMGRPSRLDVDLAADDDRVRVTGAAAVI